MREYLRKFFDYQDQLFWSKDIDDIDKRIDMWLKSDECESLIIPNVSESLSFDDFEIGPIDKDGDFEIRISHYGDDAYHYLTTEQANKLIDFLQRDLNSR